MRKSSRVAIAIGSALAVGAILQAGEVGAIEKRMHGTICHPIAGSVGAGGAGLRIASNGTELYCPWLDAPDLVRTDITEVAIYGTDANVAIGAEWVTAKTCRASTVGDSATCGSFEQQGATDYELTPPMSGWNTTTGFAYLYIDNLNTNDSVRGIWVGD